MSESDKESAPGLPSSAASASSVPHLLPDEAEDPNGLYKYRDFSNVAEEEDDASEMPPSSHSSRGHMESSIRVQKFPVKLYAILAQKEFQDIITWMPHGRSWKVLKPNLFESMVMPLFFEYSNYHSFNRLVNAWSFRRISSGPDRGSYYHEVTLGGVWTCYWSVRDSDWASSLLDSSFFVESLIYKSTCGVCQKRTRNNL